MSTKFDSKRYHDLNNTSSEDEIDDEEDKQLSSRTSNTKKLLPKRSRSNSPETQDQADGRVPGDPIVIGISDATIEGEPQDGDLLRRQVDAPKEINEFGTNFPQARGSDLGQLAEQPVQSSTGRELESKEEEDYGKSLEQDPQERC